MNSDALEKEIRKEVEHRWALPLSIGHLINIKKCRGCYPGSCRTIFNKREGVTLYQTMSESWLFIPRPFRTICKQPGPTRITTDMILWLLIYQDTPHDLRNAKQMACKTDLYWENGSVLSLPPNSCKWYDHVDLHINSRKTRLSLPVVTLWHHTRTSGIHNSQRSRNRPGNKLLRDESWNTTDINSPHRNLLPEDNKYHSVDHLTKSDPLAVDITSIEASMDGFIKDIVKIKANDKNWVERAKSAAQLVIYKILRPLQASKPLKRDDPLSQRKIAW